MKDERRLTRRAFIKLAALGAGALALLRGCTPPRRTGTDFSEDEISLLESIAEQIIPTDEWPGGRDAGVVNFIEIQLDGPYRRFRKDYRRGLPAITETCLKRYGTRFEALSWEQQTLFLRDMETGKLTDGEWKEGFSRQFFELLRNHSLQGYYGSPRHGGNKGFVSYRMIGLNELQVVGQNRHSG